MELLDGSESFVVVDGDHVLTCCKVTGKLSAKNGVSAINLQAYKCLGKIYGVIGRLMIGKMLDPQLLVITKRTEIGFHPLNKNSPIFRINQITAIPIGQTSNFPPELQLDKCMNAEHHQTGSGPNSGLNLLQKAAGQKMIKSTVNSFKISMNLKKEPLPDDLMERRLLEEILRMFNENGCFYYCNGMDLTNSIQRICEIKSKDKKIFDERFFWNRHLLDDLIAQNDSNASYWVQPIIQGFIETEFFSLSIEDAHLGPVSPESPQRPGESQSNIPVQLTIISRRSIHRAGTRYIKRGIDENGHCANSVETEQILSVAGHTLSFLQLRASIPIFWSQPGYKYRPPPVVDRPKSESFPTFQKHFAELFELYSERIFVVNLVEQMGKERVLSEAFLDHVLDFDSDSLVYVAFDFHENCRGLKFENVAVLLENLAPAIQQIRFTWADKRGEIACGQNGIFRVNCVDCLDRTNVVQTAIAKIVLEHQLRKFGLLMPEESLPKSAQQLLQIMWANNGDAISRQYAGTAALKGDFTRTGQRNLAGLMRDGYNSANRYYLSHLKDFKRQAAIDAFLGRKLAAKEIEAALVEENSKFVPKSIENAELIEKQEEEQLRLLVQDCQRMLIPETEIIMGGWALIDADARTGDDDQMDMDTVVMLTRNAFYVADYDEELDKCVDYLRIPLEEIVRIEVGPMGIALNMLGVSKAKATCIRVYFKYNDESGYMHTWRSAKTRLFNNMAIPIKTEADATEYIHAIMEQFEVALSLANLSGIPCEILGRMERKKSRVLPGKENSNGPKLVTKAIGQVTGTAMRSLNAGVRRLHSGLIGKRSAGPTAESAAKKGPEKIFASVQIFYSEIGILTSCVDSPLLRALEKSRKPVFYFSDDMALLWNQGAGVRPLKPLFCVENSQKIPKISLKIPEISENSMKISEILEIPENFRSAHSTSCIPAALKSPAGNEEIFTKSLPSSKSDMELKNLAVPNFIQKLGGGKFFVESFSKISSNFVGGQKFVPNAPVPAKIPGANFERFAERISRSKSNFILL